MERKCDNCGREYKADPRNLKRGWGLCCSKSCAATKREKSKPGYDPKRGAENDIKREMWNHRFKKDLGDIVEDEMHPHDPYSLGQE